MLHPLNYFYSISNSNYKHIFSFAEFTLSYLKKLLKVLFLPSRCVFIFSLFLHKVLNQNFIEKIKMKKSDRVGISIKIHVRSRNIQRCGRWQM